MTTTKALPEPDTHCHDEDTGLDVWSYSKDLMHDCAARVTAAKDAEIERLASERNIYKAADEAMQSQYGELHEKCDEQAQEIERLKDALIGIDARATAALKESK